MADNVAVTAGTGTSIAADEVTDGSLGSVKVQFVKLMDGTLDGTTKAAVGANGLAVNASIASAQTLGTVTTVTTLTNLGAQSPVYGTGTRSAATLRVTQATDDFDMGSGTSGGKTQRVIVDSSQLSALLTTAQPMSANYQLVAFPTDGPCVAAEDSASADGHTGLRMLAVRKATPANTSGTDGDYEFLQLSAGALWVASAATDKTLVSSRVITGGSQYETVAASQTDQILGATGAAGDYLESLICVVATAATSQVQIKDGNGSAITVLPNAVGGGVGNYTLPIGLISVNSTTPGWKVTTAAGVTVIGTGRFT